ncbi:MAG: glutathione S-transferase N-terminal domain-containing protein, partial [Oceanococcaceae bacterium]
MRVYGDSRSGNCFKIQLVAQLLGLTLDWQEVDVLSGYTRSPAFLSLNPNGKIPLLVLDDDRSLAESNAIIHYLAEGSRLIPKDPWQRA